MASNFGSFFGARLRVARAFNGLTQADLAERVDVTPAAISVFESDQKAPSLIRVEMLGEVLGFSPSYFSSPLKGEFRDEECHFRRRKTTAQKIAAGALAHGTLVSLVVDYIEEEIALPSVRFPSISVSDRESIERAAESARNYWALGTDVPIRSTVRVAECAGAVVCRYEADTIKVDAFSRSGTRPIIILNDAKGSRARSRMDCAHEIGHLVMHNGRATGTPEVEDQANAFAGAFLLPRSAFLREFPRGARIDWPSIFRLKVRWGASAAAIIRRAYELRLIGAVEYQRAFKYMRFKGWHTDEPNDSDLLIESPETIPLSMVELSNSCGKSSSSVADALGFSHAVFSRVTGIAVSTTTAACDPTRNAAVIDLARFRARSGD